MPCLITAVFLFLCTSILTPAWGLDPAIGYTTNSEGGQLTINDRVVLTIPGEGGAQHAKEVAFRLNRLQYERLLRADQILPTRQGQAVTVMVGRQPILAVDNAIASAAGETSQLLALRWTNALREALGGRALHQQMVASRSLTRGRELTGRVLSSVQGTATWYGGYFHGRYTASGEVYDTRLHTAAHRNLPFGTIVRVTNIRNGKSTVVRINDRGPFLDVPRRILDLSPVAFRELAPINTGVLPIKLEVLEAQ